MRYFRNAYYICPYRLVVFVELSYMFATKLSLELNYDCTHTHTHSRRVAYICAGYIHSVRKNLSFKEIYLALIWC